MPTSTVDVEAQYDIPHAKVESGSRSQISLLTHVLFLSVSIFCLKHAVATELFSSLMFLVDISNFCCCQFHNKPRSRDFPKIVFASQCRFTLSHQICRITCPEKNSPLPWDHIPDCERYQSTLVCSLWLMVESRYDGFHLSNMSRYRTTARATRFIYGTWYYHTSPCRSALACEK